MSEQKKKKKERKKRKKKQKNTTTSGESYYIFDAPIVPFLLDSNTVTKTQMENGATQPPEHHK